MNEIEVWVERPESRLLTFDCTTSPDGYTVPRFTRRNVAQIIYWLWEFDPEAGPEKGGSTIPYLLDDAVELLGGGVFSVMYPTDHGKSTLVDVDTTASLLLWPEETLNIHIKRAVETAILSVQGVAFKLQRAAEYFPYARPLCRWDVQTGLPQVKAGFFIEGCRLRTLGERNRSVYPAGIGSTSVQGMRGRTKIDDIEDENTLKSDAKSDTTRKQVNNSVRNLQKAVPGTVPLWAIFGTPQGANSVMYVVDSDLSTAGVRFRVIRRPRVIEDGSRKGQLLFPSTDVKRAMQQGIMDPAAYKIAYELEVPGQAQYDPKVAAEAIKDPLYPLLANQNQLKEYLYERLVQDGTRHVGFQYTDSGHLYREAQRMVSEELAIYITWDPAPVGTYAIALEAMLPKTRWIQRVEIAVGTSDEQTERILEWQYLFPDCTVVIERDGQQDAFIDILRLKDPATMIVPHVTHGYNKNTGRSGVPSMMRELQRPNRWHLPWTLQGFCEDYFATFLTELRRWGPTAHPHGIMAVWFGWYFDRASRMQPDEDENQPKQPTGQEVEVFDVVISSRRPLQDPLPRTQPHRSPSQESWDRRWPTSRRT